jgi:endonuclease-8
MARVCTIDVVPEGDSLHRAARRLQVLVGEHVEAESPNPRGQATGVADQVDGRRLEAVEAVGKNLILRFEGGVKVRSHLRMSGRWRVVARDAPIFGNPWLVLRGSRVQALLYGGRVLELNTRAVKRVGPDILAQEPDFDRMVGNLRREHPAREVGDALLDQRLVAGIGTVWRAEALWRARVSPWRRLAEISDDELRGVLREAAALMRRSADGLRDARAVYRRTSRPCPRCGTAIESRGQGDANRTAYWCPVCQPSPASSDTLSAQSRDA